MAATRPRTLTNASAASGPARALAPFALFAPIAPEGAGMPLYRAVKRALLQAIESGQLPPGATLPSEARLAGSFGTSVGTLRHAVDELVAEHILVRRQGRGTFVATHSAARFLFQFFHVERSDGLRQIPQVELLGFARHRLDDEEAAAALHLRPGDPVLQFDNRLSLQGRAVVLDQITLPAGLYKGPAPSTSSTSRTSASPCCAPKSAPAPWRPTATWAGCWAWRRAARCCRCGAGR
jgi:GntR family transcriptional regulator